MINATTLARGDEFPMNPGATSENAVTEKFAQTTREAASTGVWDGG